jgi:hypothetical protein
MDQFELDLARRRMQAKQQTEGMGADGTGAALGGGLGAAIGAAGGFLVGGPAGAVKGGVQGLQTGMALGGGEPGGAGQAAAQGSRGIEAMLEAFRKRSAAGAGVAPEVGNELEHWGR